ncbi:MULTISPECIES: molecular chaperone [unclassified Pseudomonas]|uniref:Molecular chaperone n=1 Tax=Pseudomonas sp. Hg7Tf TaxID=3236988 RepID=A0AB39I612_9PSED|nr:MULTISPECIES: molecular chaperone [unclassified Pseudomonas]MDH2561791.1 molecular chaperone [Pseudomonas sp. Hg5Tf]QYX48915.1 molecular chaperone [Pseudomonas sp. S11A 273]
MKSTLVLRWCLFMALAAPSSFSIAGVQVGGTRVIYPATDREATIQVRNEGAEDIMIQSWIEAASNQAESDVPFAITPSLARLSHKKQQALRIFYQGKGLPEDRESVFWLSVQEIPQLTGTDNNLQVAFRQRLKLFYRPAKLPGTPDEAAKNLSWKLVSNSGETMLLANNSSAFNVSLGVAKVIIGGREYLAEAEMVGPKSSAKMKIKNPPKNVRESTEVRWESVNDFGALVKYQSVIQR